MTPAVALLRLRASSEREQLLHSDGNDAARAAPTARTSWRGCMRSRAAKKPRKNSTISQLIRGESCKHKSPRCHRGAALGRAQKGRIIAEIRGRFLFLCLLVYACFYFHGGAGASPCARWKRWKIRQEKDGRTRRSPPAASVVGTTEPRASPLTLSPPLLGGSRDKTLASAGRPNPPPMETFAQKGSLSALLASLETDNTR